MFVHCLQNYPPEIAEDCGKWNVSIVTKSHVFSCAAAWDRALVLLRHPLHAIRAEYQRANTWNQTAVVNEQQWDWDDWYKKLEKNCRRWKHDYEAVLGCPAGLRTASSSSSSSSSSAGITTGSSSSSGCAALNHRTTHVFFYEDLKGPSGELNAHFLDQLLQLLGVEKADSYYDCALAFSEGRFKRSYPEDASHPAVQVLTDERSQQIVANAGCLDAYNAYRAAYPRLLPLPS
jgi:hypothetical protein